MKNQKYCYRIFRHMFLLRAASDRRTPPSFGGSVRRLAEEDGIKVPCCPYCHTQNDVKIGYMIIRWLRSYLKLPGSLRGKNMQ